MKIFSTYTNSVDPDEMQHYAVFQANLKNIFVSPYPTLFYRYGSVGFFVNFSNWIPIKLNCIL